MAQETIVLVSDRSDKFKTAQDDINANFTELYSSVAGGVPSSRTITVNGTTFDLSANRTFTVTDANLSTTDVTTNNSSTSKHGFLKKLSNVSTEYMDGTGNWSTPASSGAAWGSITGTLSDQTDLQSALDAKANDGDVVHDTGDETIAGVKTFTSDPIIPDEAYGSGWNGVLEPPTKNAVYDQIESIRESPIIKIYNALGGALKAEPYWGELSEAGQAFSLVDGRIYFTAVYLEKAATITGASFYQTTQGNFTGDNFNGIGLYTYSGGNLTQVRVSANDANIWKGTSGSLQKVPFTATYDADPGVYFVAFLYNNSAQTTAPAIAMGGTISSAVYVTLDFTNSAKLSSQLSSQTALPSPTQAMSGLTSALNKLYAGLY